MAEQFGQDDASLDAMIANSPMAFVVSNPRIADNPIIKCNAAFSELTGYPESEIIGRNCRFLSGEGTEPWLTEMIRDGVRRRKPVLVEILNYKRDGTPFRNAVLVAPIFDDCGELKYFLGSQTELESDALPASSSRHLRAVQMVKALSPRQKQVLAQIARGFMNKQIAHTLDLSEKTVKMHRALLLSKMGVTTTADAIRIAVEAGL